MYEDNIAHQYKIRQIKENEEKNTLQFNINDANLKKTIIKKISKNEAKKIIIEYEYLKSLPLFCRYFFGIYFIINECEYLGGVLIFSDEYSLNTNAWNKYSFKDNMILLSRGVCLWWTPKNTASYFINKTLKWLKINTKYRVITATTDPTAGEIGIIYQSLNWKYLGVMKGNYINGKERSRFSVLINGKLRYSRSIRKEFGNMKKDIILKKYPNAIFINQSRKRRYIGFFGNKTENKKYINEIKHLFLDYPKKDKQFSGYIYKITNIINNKIYIGQSTMAFSERINDYKLHKCNEYLINSFNKYGFENFKFEIIDTAEDINELNIKEIKYIQRYNSNNRDIGYNIELGGRNAIPNESTLKKMSEAHSGIIQTKNWIKKRIAPAGSEDAKKYGVPKTEEEKKYLSENSPKFWLGKNRSEETKLKISQTKKEKGLSDVQKELLCKKVVAYNPLNNETLNILDSSTIAGKYYNISQSTISRRCSGVSKNKGNIYFKYINNN